MLSWNACSSCGNPLGWGPGRVLTLQPPFSGQGRTGCVWGGEPGQKRVGSVETGWGREAGERRILLPLNALSPSSPRAAGKSTSDFSPSARIAVATWDHCRHGVLSSCRLTKSWVSTPRSASCRSISGDQAASLTESLTEEAQSDWELVFSGQQMFSTWGIRPSSNPDKPLRFWDMPPAKTEGRQGQTWRL